MNIYCEWNGSMLLVKSGDKVIATVDSAEDPVLLFMDGQHPSFTRGELDYIWDNYDNMQKV
jgi:hypothetical protein